MQKNKQELVEKASFLTGEKIVLRLLNLDDCQQAYFNWLNDPVVNQFLETRWHEQSIDKIKEFVASMLKDEANYLFAITDRKTQQHVGNIKLGPINFNHQYADVSYFIGDKTCWGKGFASEAIKVVTRFGFEMLKLNRVQAGLYESNIGSAKALEKAGFHLEATFEKQLKFKSHFENHLWFVRFNE